MEGRGIWVEVDGCLTDGSLDHVTSRLTRLAQLKFEVVVLGVHRVQDLDEAGTRLLVTFVDRVADGGGSVLVVDPDGCTRGVAGRFVRATIASAPPAGTWWLR